MKKYFQLFSSMFAISSFTFGGGYVIIPMLEKYFVDKYQYISKDELLNMYAIAQSAPGAIAVNTATLVSYHIGGYKGVVIGCVGTVLPPLLILSVVSNYYDSFISNQIILSALKGMEAGVVTIIVSFVIDMTSIISKEKNIILLMLIPTVFILAYFLKVSFIILILGSFLLCIIQGIYNERLKESYHD